MSIKKLYLACQNKDEAALEMLIIQFHPLIMKVSLRYGYFDEDCYQECAIAIIKSIEKFSIR
ncbi:helix-turn-helix domain-containing protein [Listeria monocytogenes]|uniref:helix-turn-helix domain-containing protein n=1 Tax=Listeria TaxID=1637 RepID=UPI0010B4BF4F|nr:MULTISPECIES: helix-turn-helix domain-containing protein [Listeria]EAC4616597.1 helix-turn-helix domain-containing protein [Listeria monocytogenes]EAD0622756.1 helix-turn-helix domain-containing protein [Listeria monocytogenes]EAD7631554.1 helix-turn-helix domain-containing protein [Listeria monocytogenes]EAD8592516.1 helix-turn-helix domain-containing protein [Listeria monocytogenes]EAF1670598.1 helix-turn-helix domain-containing protein [Listeria monocytogenes]